MNTVSRTFTESVYLIWISTSAVSPWWYDPVLKIKLWYLDNPLKMIHSVKNSFKMYIHKPAPEIFRFSSLFDFTMLRKTTNYFLRARLLVEFIMKILISKVFKNDFLWKSDSYWILISYRTWIHIPTKGSAGLCKAYVRGGTVFQENVILMSFICVRILHQDNFTAG